MDITQIQETMDFHKRIVEQLLKTKQDFERRIANLDMTIYEHNSKWEELNKEYVAMIFALTDQNENISS